MNADQYILWKMEQDDKLRDLVNKSYGDATMDNIKLMRGLIINFIIISSAIIGFTLPVFGRTELIKSSLLLSGGLGELLIVVIYGFWYLTWMLQQENRDLVIQHNKWNGYLDKLRDSRNEFFANMTVKNKEVWFEKQKEVLNEIQNSTMKKQKPDYSLDIIFAAFFIGLTLIVLSLFNIPLIS